MMMSQVLFLMVLAMSVVAGGCSDDAESTGGAGGTAGSGGMAGMGGEEGAKTGCEVVCDACLGDASECLEDCEAGIAEGGEFSMCLDQLDELAECMNGEGCVGIGFACRLQYGEWVACIDATRPATETPR